MNHPHRPRTISAQQRIAALVAAALARPSGTSTRQARQQVAALAWDARLAGDWGTYRAVMRHLKDLRARTKASGWKPTPDGQEPAWQFRITSPAQRRRAVEQHDPGSNALIAISSTQERWTAPEPALRSLGRTRIRAVHDTFNGQGRRERERRACEYAERWYQALRDWQVWVTREEAVPRRERGTGEGRMRSIVGNWASRPLVVQERDVVTPWRNLPEGCVAPLVTADATLSRIRDGRVLASLVDERGGWNRDRARALHYAHAVLTLAFTLGDPKAHEHLRVLPVAEFPGSP